MSDYYEDKQGALYQYTAVSSGSGSASLVSFEVSAPTIQPGKTVSLAIADTIYPNGSGKPGYNVIAIEDFAILGPINPITVSGVIQNFAQGALSGSQNVNEQNVLESLTFGSDNGTDDSLQSAPGGITQNRDGTSYVDSNKIFIDSLTNDATIQVPGYEGQYIYSTSIVQAIQYDYPDLLNTAFNYNAVTTTQGLDYVFTAA